MLSGNIFADNSVETFGLADLRVSIRPMDKEDCRFIKKGTQTREKAARIISTVEVPPRAKKEFCFAVICGDKFDMAVLRGLQFQIQLHVDGVLKLDEYWKPTKKAPAEVWLEGQIPDPVTGGKAGKPVPFCFGGNEATVKVRVVKRFGKGFNPISGWCTWVFVTKRITPAPKAVKRSASEASLDAAPAAKKARSSPSTFVLTPAATSKPSLHPTNISKAAPAKLVPKTKLAPKTSAPSQPKAQIKAKPAPSPVPASPQRKRPVEVDDSDDEDVIVRKRRRVAADDKPVKAVSVPAANINKASEPASPVASPVVSPVAAPPATTHKATAAVDVVSAPAASPTPVAATPTPKPAPKPTNPLAPIKLTAAILRGTKIPRVRPDSAFRVTKTKSTRPSSPPASSKAGSGESSLRLGGRSALQVAERGEHRRGGSGTSSRHVLGELSYAEINARSSHPN